MTPDIDDVAVERACQGDRSVRLNRDEVAEAHRQLTARGMGPAAIADLLGVSERAVLRWRAGAVPQTRPGVTPFPQYRGQDDYMPEPFKDAGLTYRQVDHWCNRGYLKPVRHGRGSGYPRRWPDEEIAVGLRMAELIGEGFRHDVAARRARQQVSA